MTSRYNVWAVSAAVVAATFVPSSFRSSMQMTGRANATSSRSVTVTEIHAAMNQARTARIRGTITFDGSSLKGTLSGVARFASGEYEESARVGHVTIEQRVIGTVVFSRGLLSKSWCRASTADFPAITVNEVVFAVKATNAKPVRVGVATIAKVPTTHYRLSPRNGTVVNYWIDAKDRIVEMKWESDEGEHDTEDFYDYGAAVPKIIAPSNAPNC